MHKNTALTVLISDGRQGHAIVVKGIGEKVDSFLFQDSWGDESWLGRGNNAAGVAAKALPGGFWSVSRDEMKKVVAAFVVPQYVWSEMNWFKQGIARADASFTKECTARSAAFKVFRATRDDPMIDPRRLENRAVVYAVHGETELAMKTALLLQQLYFTPQNAGPR